MTSYLVPPICSAIDKRSGRTATVYKPYWSTNGRFPVIFQDSPRVAFIAASKHLDPQHIINQELAVQYGFTKGCWLGPHRESADGKPPSVKHVEGPINATDQCQETGPSS